MKSEDIITLIKLLDSKDKKEESSKLLDMIINDVNDIYDDYKNNIKLMEDIRTKQINELVEKERKNAVSEYIEKKKTEEIDNERKKLITRKDYKFSAISSSELHHYIINTITGDISEAQKILKELYGNDDFHANIRSKIRDFYVLINSKMPVRSSYQSSFITDRNKITFNNELKECKELIKPREIIYSYTLKDYEEWIEPYEWKCYIEAIEEVSKRLDIKNNLTQLTDDKKINMTLCLRVRNCINLINNTKYFDKNKHLKQLDEIITKKYHDKYGKYPENAECRQCRNLHLTNVYSIYDYDTWIDEEINDFIESLTNEEQ